MPAALDQIKTYCHSLGFDLVGFTRPAKYTSFSIFAHWIEAGYHADMQYLASAQSLRLRQSPLVLMPTCQSIIVLAYRYPGDILPTQESQHGNPSIAAYARGRDYHNFLPPRMEQIKAYIQSLFVKPVTALCYTDTAPILEKELGVRAGLGWIGKNTCLINPFIGSYFFLSEILLDVDLLGKRGDEYQLPDRCGTCHRCIDICPTHCIKDDRTLDASNCIAYLTIENKGAIPFSAREQVGNHLFGCDLCQQVCPWNKNTGELIADLPEKQEVLDHLEIATYQQISGNEEFNHYFNKTPIKRANRRGFYRNLAVVLGNSLAKNTYSILEKLLQDTDALVRQHAAWALGKHLSPESLPLLRTALSQETDKKVIKEIELALHRKEAQ
ncbi:MAG: Epoxyqueuosine reductase [Anaerolinea thermophila]|uniref:Epoxyqueuosine reductase n=1 Tax=Anaerolinea thermophila TaxID=167964 RepID=A0A101FY15_9CHLR|nr:MAG: Epoxyqueuosine reductase [Anaerolinea thermophila]